MNKAYVGKSKPKTTKSYHKRNVYLITNNFTPLIAQYEDTKSLLLGFTYKKEAIEFAQFIEMYYRSNYIWPQLNLEDTFTVYTNTYHYKDDDSADNIDYKVYKSRMKNRLDILDVNAWNYKDLTEFCKYSICDLALIQTKIEDNTITYEISITNIESSIEDMVHMCNNMYYT